MPSVEGNYREWEKPSRKLISARVSRQKPTNTEVNMHERLEQKLRRCTSVGEEKKVEIF